MSTDLITEHLDLWTSAVTYNNGKGRGNNGEPELTGIQKLRELILELAVRGKLVPQDPEDEPASKLLERIEEEKKRLYKEGKIKKPKKLPEVSEDEKPYEVPEGWVWARLVELFEIQDSYRIPLNKKERNKREGKYPYYGANGQIGTIDDYIFEGRRILIAEDGGFFSDPIRGVAYIAEGRFWVNNHAHVLRCIGSTNEKFWISYFNQFDWLPYVRGMTRYKLNQATMQKIPLPVPPLAEQKRIAEKVDELMALCDRLEQQTSAQISAHETLVDTLLDTLTRSQDAAELADNWARLAEHFDTLFTTEHSIDRLEQTIIQLAVMGRLVPQDPKDEPASKLLERTRLEKEQLVKEKKIKKPQKLSEVSEEEKYFVLPDKWVWARFGETGYTRLGKMLDKAKNQGLKKKYLRNTNVQWWSFDLEELKELMLEENELKEYSVNYGDLLICEGGEPGRCAVWRDEDSEMYIQKAIHRHRPLGGISPDYLKICLTVDFHSGRLSQLFTGTTIKHLPGDNLAKYVIPLPPIKQQCKIVEKVNEFMALCDRLKAHLNKAGETQVQLAEIIVNRAIDGEVPDSTESQYCSQF